jgi:hypothetical protein
MNLTDHTLAQSAGLPALNLKNWFADIPPMELWNGPDDSRRAVRCMSAIGQKATFQHVRVTSGLRPDNGY